MVSTDLLERLVCITSLVAQCAPAVPRANRVARPMRSSRNFLRYEEHDLPTTIETSSCSPHLFFNNLLTSLQASTNYKEAFALFDKRGNGRVALESLGDLLRACGQNPTLAEIKDLERNVGGDCKMPLRKQ